MYNSIYFRINYLNIDMLNSFICTIKNLKKIYLYKDINDIYGRYKYGFRKVSFTSFKGYRPLF